LDKCCEIFDGEKVRKITDKDKEEILKNIDDLASNARRNLAIAYRKLDKYSHDEMTMEEVENDMIFV
jgi:magnesium-transporting ATPase (P-type)